MLSRSKGSDLALDASYTAVWAHLRKRYPRLRTIMAAAASGRDDATVAAMRLAEAAARLDGSTILVMLHYSAMLDPHGVDAFAVPTVRVLDGLSAAQVRSALAEGNEKFACTIVVGPAPQTDPDCISLALLADVAILVARPGHTQFAEAQLAARLLRQSGVTVAAALLVQKRKTRRVKSIDTKAGRLSGHRQQVAEVRQVGFGDRPVPPEVVGDTQGQTTGT
jgi:Mrp family chromosome partitioning ATPase